MSEKLILRFLGQIEIEQNNVPLPKPLMGKTLALLSYLAVTGGAHNRSALAGLLWSNMPETKARGNLSKALSTLRRQVGEHITITRQTVACAPNSNFLLDVTEFEARVNDASIARLQEAIQLYQGDFLEGFQIRNAPEFEIWVLAQRTRLKELALRALHILTTHFATQDEDGQVQAIDYTRQLLQLEPWREEAHRQLMYLLAQTGQRGAALAQYEICQQILTEELAVKPATETRELYEQIRDGIFELKNDQEKSLRVEITSHPHASNLPYFLEENTSSTAYSTPSLCRT